MLLNTCSNVAAKQTLLFRCPSSPWGWGRASQCGPPPQPPTHSPSGHSGAVTMLPLLIPVPDLASTVAPITGPSPLGLLPWPLWAKVPRASLWVWVPAWGPASPPAFPPAARAQPGPAAPPTALQPAVRGKSPPVPMLGSCGPGTLVAPQGAAPAMLRTQCQTQAQAAAHSRSSRGRASPTAHSTDRSAPGE